MPACWMVAGRYCLCMSGATYLNAGWWDGIAELEVVLAQELGEVVQQHQQQAQAALRENAATDSTQSVLSTIYGSTTRQTGSSRAAIPVQLTHAGRTSNTPEHAARRV